MLKSMGEAHFRIPPLRNPSTNFDDMSNILLRPKRADVQNLVGIDSAVTDLRMREKNAVCLDFLINISVCLSIYLSVSSSGLQVTVLGQC